MEFLEDLEMYEQAMENAYNVVTGKITIEQVYVELESSEEELEFPLPFNPFLQDDISDDDIDAIIDHFIALEEYEKCAELVECKKERNAKGH